VLGAAVLALQVPFMDYSDALYANPISYGALHHSLTWQHLWIIRLLFDFYWLVEPPPLFWPATKAFGFLITTVTCVKCQQTCVNILKL
jgi:hypothetical protein